MSSQEYWRKREEAHIREMQKKQEDYDKEIARIYERNFRQIEKEINNFYVKYADEEGISMAEAKKRVNKMDVEAFSEKAAEYVKKKDFSDEANEQLKLYNLTMKVNRLELLKSEIGLELASMGSEFEHYMNETLTEEAKAEAKRQAGILGETLDTFDAKRIDAIVKGSYRTAMKQYQLGNSTFSERIWGNNASLKSNLDKLLTQAIINGKHPTALARDLKKQFGVSQREAERLMRTESARIQGALAVESMLENDIQEYEWVSEPTACPICKPLNGKRFKVKDARVADKSHPLFPMHPNCRCAIVPVFEMSDEEYEAWLEHIDKGGTTEEWESRSMLHTYDDPIREILGSAFDSHPKEVAAIIKELKSKEIEIEYRDNAMGYMPNPTPGKSGKFVIERAASYSAWLHERQHVYDDEASGWKGFRNFSNPEIAARMEDKAYDIEIDFAKSLGYNDVVKRLEELKVKRHREVLGQ